MMNIDPKTNKITYTNLKATNAFMDKFAAAAVKALNAHVAKSMPKKSNKYKKKRGFD